MRGLHRAAGRRRHDRNQLRVLREFAEKSNLTIVREYVDDGWSGDILARPALDGLCSGRWTKQAGITDAIGKLVSRFWEHGKFFLWGSAIACALALSLIFGGWMLGISAAVSAFSEYGLIVLIGAVVLLSLAVARSWEGRPKRNLFFEAEEEQSIWGHAPQKKWGDLHVIQRENACHKCLGQHVPHFKAAHNLATTSAMA